MLCILSWLPASFSQDAVFQGQIKCEDGFLENATIIIGGKTSISNSLGEFSVSVKAGTYMITITHAGYNKIEKNITLFADESELFQLIMIRNEMLGEVVVLGSRSLIQRSNLTTSVPVDQLASKELRQTGQPSLLQMLNYTIPSFNTSRQSLFEPVTLRGLGPDHLLILLNGTRYHGPATLDPGLINGLLGRGSVGNDLNSIPISAIEKIEVLRDGASAQYGSDAIAGVMNIELKKTTGITSVDLHLGQHYKGDGENIVFGMHHGISLHKKSLPANRQGFMNFSGDFRYRKPTHRGGEFLGTVYYNIPPNTSQPVRDSIIALDNKKIQERGFSRKTPVSNDGSIQLVSSGILINGGYYLKSKTELFWTGTINYRRSVYPGAYRFPKNSPRQVNIALHPDGFKQESVLHNWDATGIAGARGRINRKWFWEWKSTYGKNRSPAHLRNTNNASQYAMGANAPTEFYVGVRSFTQQINAFNVSRDFARETGSIKTFNVDFGAEYRFENYQVSRGQEDSWKNYDLTGRTQSPGGISPESEVNENRQVAAIFADFETDINDYLLINTSGRYEYYNDFGSSLAGKLAVRYKIFPGLSVRGSLSNSYHAPPIQQIFFNSITSGWKNVGGNLIPSRLGTFSNNSIITQAFGVHPLQPEKSINFSGGFTSVMSKHYTLTVDGYWIEIKNRIVLSGRFDRTNPHVNGILQNHPDIDQVQFFANAINTKTRGVDIVLNGKWNINKARLGLALAANFTRTNIFGVIQSAEKLPADSLNTNTLFNREEREKIERGQPANKIILSGNYKKGKMELLIRGTRFGKTSIVLNSANKEQDEFFSPKILTDISIGYTPKSWLTITGGSNNVLDVYPDQVRNPLNRNEGILIYSNQANPYGYNGGYYYLSMSFNWE